MNFYSRESTGPKCEKSSKFRLRNEQDDGHRQVSSTDGSKKRMKTFEPNGVVLEEPMRRVTKPRKEYMTKRKREAAAQLANRNSQSQLSDAMMAPSQVFQFDGQHESSQPYSSSQNIRVNTCSSIESMISTNSNELESNNVVLLNL